jgi:hypothetical protein
MIGRAPVFRKKQSLGVQIVNAKKPIQQCVHRSPAHHLPMLIGFSTQRVNVQSGAARASLLVAVN